MRMPGCFECSQLTSGDCGKHGPYTWGAPSTTQPAQGWVCPVCHAVYAPWVASCLQCPKPPVAEFASVSEFTSFVKTVAGKLCPVCLGDVELPPRPSCRCDEHHSASRA